MITKYNTVVKLNTFNVAGDGILQVGGVKPIDSAILIIEGDLKFTFNGNLQTNLVGKFSVKDPILWSIDNPHLYSYILKIKYADGECETIADNLGFRTLSSCKNGICVNGSPIFIKGYIRGATAHDHNNNYSLSKAEFFRKNLLQAKAFGFNYVRWHSVIPDEQFFEEADKVGILVHIEMRSPQDVYDNLKEMVTTGSVTIRENDIEAISNRLFNHPSFAVYCIGNEIKDISQSAVIGIKHAIDKNDGTRLFLDTCAWGKNNRSNVDFDVQHMGYYFPFASKANMYSDVKNLLVANGGDESYKFTFDVSLIAHEVCHYTALRDFKLLKEKFKKANVTEPWWIDEEIKMIEAKGLTDIYPTLYSASKHFQKECWKQAFEEIRSSQLLRGYHFLQLSDTDIYENSNGILDCFDDINGTTPEEFLTFNGDRVIVAHLGMRHYVSGCMVDIPVTLSSYVQNEIDSADVHFDLVKSDGEVYSTCNILGINIKNDGAYDLCNLKVNLPLTNSMQQLVAKIKLVANGITICENSWDVWVHPKRQLKYEQFVNYSNGDILITDDIEKVFSALESGKKVCLIYRKDWTRHCKTPTMQNPKYAFRATWNRFKPVVWDRGTNYGGIVEDVLMAKYGFMSGNFYDFCFDVLSEDCDKIILDDFPCKVRSIVRGIDKSCRDRFDASWQCFNLPELMYDRTLRNFSYLFELKVGNGSLLVCGLNMCGLDSDEPSTVSMAEFIKSYITSDDFNPTNEISLEVLKEYMEKCATAPVKERMMTQFWQLDDSPVESKEYWKRSKEYLMEK